MTKDVTKFEWRALPDGVLAYGDTGFEIREQPEASDPHAALIVVDPQGRRIDEGGYGNLDYLKIMAEDAARDAQAFNTGVEQRADGGHVGPARPEALCDEAFQKWLEAPNEDRSTSRAFRAGWAANAKLLHELERAVSALHAHDLHGAILPRFRDLHSAVMAARKAAT